MALQSLNGYDRNQMYVWNQRLILVLVCQRGFRFWNSGFCLQNKNLSATNLDLANWNWIFVPEIALQTEIEQDSWFWTLSPILMFLWFVLASWNGQRDRQTDEQRLNPEHFCCCENFIKISCGRKDFDI